MFLLPGKIVFHLFTLINPPTKNRSQQAPSSADVCGAADGGSRNYLYALYEHTWSKLFFLAIATHQMKAFVLRKPVSGLLSLFGIYQAATDKKLWRYAWATKLLFICWRLGWWLNHYVFFFFPPEHFSSCFVRFFLFFCILSAASDKNVEDIRELKNLQCTLES